MIHSVTELIPQTHRTSNKDSDSQEGMSSMDTGDQTVKQVLHPEEANIPQCSNPSASKKRSLNEDERESQKVWVFSYSTISAHLSGQIRKIVVTNIIKIT